MTAVDRRWVRERKCDTCDNVYVSSRRRCEECRLRNKDVFRHGLIASIPNMPSTQLIGAASELIASAALMRMGYYVFRSMTPTCPCDLVVMTRHGDLSKVEVKSRDADL